MIAFEEVVIRYARTGTPAVDGVSFHTRPGIITAVAGPNGSGKSTLVRALLGRVRPEHGTIRLDGAPLDTLDRRSVARRVAVVTQREESVFPVTVRELVTLGRFAHAGPLVGDSSRDREVVETAMQRAGVDALAGRRTDTLSGGEWQRVRVARALAQEAPALVLDEPTTFLDIAHEMELFELLEALAAEGRVVLVISHQLSLLARFAARVVLLHRGRVAATGDTLDVLQPAILEQVYDWPIHVQYDAAAGVPAVVPLRRTDTRSTHFPR